MQTTRPTHPGHAILVNLGITAKNVTRFTIECAGPDVLPTITLTQVVLGLPEPTYSVSTREIASAQPIGFDLDAACQSAREKVAEAIEWSYLKARIAMADKFYAGKCVGSLHTGGAA